MSIPAPQAVSSQATHSADLSAAKNVKPVPQITKVILPKLERICEPALKPIGEASLDKERLFEEFQKLAEMLFKLYDKEFHQALENSPFSALLKLDPSKFILTPQGREAFRATLDVLKELTTTKYTQESGIAYTRFVTNLLWTHLQGGQTFEAEKVEALAKRLQSKYEVHPTEDSDNVHALKDKEDFAVIKQAKPSYLPSQAFAFEGYPTFNLVDRALCCYELDALIGLNRVPTSLKVETHDGRTAIVQPFIPNCIDGGSVLTSKGGGKLMKTLDKSHTQVCAIADMIRGVCAGHFGQYVLVTNLEKDRAIDILEVDLKEGLGQFIRPPAHLKIRRSHPDRPDEFYHEELSAERDAEARKNIVMCRAWALGFPQNAKPFDRALLMILIHPSLKTIIEGHHKSSAHYDIPKEAFLAVQERVLMLQDFARKELSQEKLTASPQDFYFEMFGGRAFFEIALKKNWPPALIFNQVVGNPYRPDLPGGKKTDWSRIAETLFERPADRPASESESAKTAFANFQELAKE